MDREKMPRLPGDELRCDCGSLVAKVVEAGVELKCRRCKRIKVIPLLPVGARKRGWKIKVH